MRRIDTPDGMYHDADPNAGVAGTVVKAAPLNALQEEIIAVITAAGVELDPESMTQLRDAILAITGGGSLPWGAITDKPETFPPDPDQDASLITTGVLPVARGGTGAGNITAGNYLVGNGSGPLASKTPAQVLTDIAAAPVGHTHAISNVNGLQSALDTKAPLLSPQLAGSPTAPTPTATDNSTRIATTAFAQQLISNLINGSPGALDTLNELAAAMGDDPNFAATVTNALAGKLAKAGDTMSGTLSFQGNGTAARRFNVFHNANASSDFGGKVQLDAGNSTTPLGGMVIVPYGGNGFQTRIDWYAKAGDFYNSPYNLAMSLNYSGLTISGSLAFGENLISSTANLVAGTNGAGTIYLRPNGVGSTSGQLSLSSAGNLAIPGAVTAAGGFQVSDRRFKKNIASRALDETIAAKLAPLWSQWNRKSDGAFDTGLIAQDVLRIAPQFVQVPEDPEDMLAIDKAGIALECVLSAELRIQQLLARLEALEKRA